VFALGLGVLAAAIAIPLAAYVGRAYSRFAATMLNFSIDGYSIPLYAILLQLAAGLLLPVLAAAVPVMRGSRIPVAEALRDTGIPNEASASWIDRIHGLNRPLLLSLRNAFRRRWRMALTLVTLASGGAAFLGALDLRAAIRGSVGTMYEDRLRFDLAVRLSNPHAADSAIAAASRVAGVSRVEAFAGARVTLADADELEAPIPLTAIPADSRLLVLPVTEGRGLGDGVAPEIIVTAQLLDEHPSLTRGAPVELMIGGRRSRWTVVGVVESAGPGAAAFVTRASLAHVTGDARVSSVVVRTTSRDGARQGEVLQRVRDSLEGDGLAVEASQLMQASRRSIEDHLLMVGDFLLAMAQLTILVGALALASTMSLAVRERTREIGVLRAIGGTPRSIMTMVQAEGFVIVCLSWVVAIPLSLPISVLLARAFGRILFPVPTSFVPQGAAVVTWLALAVVVSVLACAWPAYRATRSPIVAALAYE
jgi:putative ABC transport system permease protein